MTIAALFKHRALAAPAEAPKPSDTGIAYVDYGDLAGLAQFFKDSISDKFSGIPGVLRVESLAATLRMFTFNKSHVKLWKDIPKLPALATPEDIEQSTAAPGDESTECTHGLEYHRKCEICEVTMCLECGRPVADFDSITEWYCGCDMEDE